MTGYLGSGKTTLLNKILSEEHGKRIAVIENEYGEVGIDQGLVINADEEVFEMSNGCICCTVRGDLIRVLGNLMKRRDKFDYVLVETTGLADPGPVAQTFFMDDEIRDEFTLDGIVTLIDAAHIDQQLERSNESSEQVAFADVLILNKSDLVPEESLVKLESRLGDPAVQDIKMLVGFRPPAVLGEHPRLERRVLPTMNCPPGQQGLTELSR
ncbi:CobW-like pseudocobalamin biosynthesis protein [Synechococcus sp. BIOS-E4-1]|nr:CobW-like pseudocobalamin biosynthesis protein [Synechococcus sp. BIOS-E4-1]